VTARGYGMIEFDNCNLKEVVYIPELSTNLLSVRAITDSEGEVHFVGNEVSITYNNKIILKGYKQKNGLFQIKMKADQKEKSYFSEDYDNAAMIWH